MYIGYPQWGNNICPKCGKPYGPVVNDLPVDLCTCGLVDQHPWPDPPFRVGKVIDGTQSTPAVAVGWMCPHCRMVYSPWVQSCGCQRNPEAL